MPVTRLQPSARQFGTAAAALIVSVCLRIVPGLVAQNQQADQRCKPYPDVALQPLPSNGAPGPEYAPSTRMYQATPTVERTRNGRLWAAWVSGGPDEGPLNYVLLATSEDDGKSWSNAKLVIAASGNVAATDPRLWYDDRGRLWLFWSQAYAASDGRNGVWAIVGENPEVPSPSWSQPVRIADGDIGGKPIITANGQWLLPIYLESGISDFDEAVGFYHLGLSPCVEHALKHDPGTAKGASVYRSRNEGSSWEWLGKPNLSPTAIAAGDEPVEHMIVQRHDGSLWMLLRTPAGIGQSFSHDGGKTWTEIEPSGIRHPLSRFFLRRLQSGRLLLVRHNPPSVEYPRNCKECGEANRSHLTAYLSDDDGKSWTGGLLLDERATVSYPDGTQGTDGTIFIVYDRDRRTAREILLSLFKEDDILKRSCTTPTCRLRVVVSKGASDTAVH
jgi:hypothetical protein